MGFGMGYGGLMAPFGGYAGTLGIGLSSPRRRQPRPEAPAEPPHLPPAAEAPRQLVRAGSLHSRLQNPRPSGSIHSVAESGISDSDTRQLQYRHTTAVGRARADRRGAAGLRGAPAAGPDGRGDSTRLRAGPPSGRRGGHRRRQELRLSRPGHSADLRERTAGRHQHVHDHPARAARQQGPPVPGPLPAPVVHVRSWPRAGATTSAGAGSISPSAVSSRSSGPPPTSSTGSADGPRPPRTARAAICRSCRVRRRGTRSAASTATAPDANAANTAAASTTGPGDAGTRPT